MCPHFHNRSGATATRYYTHPPYSLGSRGRSTPISLPPFNPFLYLYFPLSLFLSFPFLLSIWKKQRHITLIHRHKPHTAAAAALLCNRNSGRTANRPRAVQARVHGLWPAATQPYTALVYRLMVSIPVIHVIHELLLIYRPRRDGKLSWPGWLSHLG